MTEPPRPAACLLAELAHADVQVSLRDDGQLALSAAPGVVTAGLIDRVRAQKPALQAWLGELRAAGQALATLQPDPARAMEPFPTADMQSAFAIGDSEAL